MSDLSAEVNQSACDKLLSSIEYPLVVVERKEDFPGCSRLALASEGAFYRYTDDEVDDLFEKSVEQVVGNQQRSDQDIYDQVYAFGGEIIQQAKLMLDAVGRDGYEGPTEQELTAIVDGGIQNLGKNLRGFLGDWGIYAWNPYLRILIRDRPALTLRSPRIDLNNLEFQVKATGELWAKYPWWNCYKWCLKWKKVIKCNRIGSITVALDMKFAAHADIAARGAKVFAKPRVDRLRLNYPILDKIPLEVIADPLVAKKEIVAYDASKLVASVPTLGTSFGVDGLALPPSNTGIEVGVTIKEL